MPRLPRMYSESGYYHVMLRGINREKIFEDDACKKRFMDILKRNFTASDNEEENKKRGQLFAFCILDNHVHLLVRESFLGISNLMQRISGAYAHYYNRRYGRSGPVFESRYTSKAVESPKYFAEVVKYIHNNPVKAGIVQDFRQYHWSSGRHYLYNELSFLVTEVLKKHMSDKEFLEFMDTPACCQEPIMVCRWPERIPDFEVWAAAHKYGEKEAFSRMNKGALFSIIKTLMKMKGVAKTQIARVLGINMYTINKAIASRIQEDVRLAPGQ